ILGVHLFGNPAPVQELEELAQRKGLALLYDSAHGFGSLQNGKALGGNGKVEVFSLSPTKLLIAGEGGIAATNDSQIAEHIRLGRNYGNPGNYDSLFSGINARMSEFHALCALQSLEQLEKAAMQRNHIVCYYKKRLSQLPGIRFQTVAKEDHPLYYELVRRFNEKTGCPVIINTSFNVRGEPIVCTPQEAYGCFMHTHMDYLVLENCLLDKREQPALENGSLGPVKSD
ncbi:MAG: DegT/DnrJ/EryC1/StrS family aminotransferase, partial [Candidatus Marinimicrobia bacterium]|nr:DegT/DnrJ/EryC1/StrS family aminotransferase [Candidatus Neomarinimicrobiota bacterium]